MAKTKPSASAVKARKENWMALYKNYGYFPAGILDVFKNRHGLVEIYNSEAAGLDADGGAYTVICNGHHMTIATDSLAIARDLAKSTGEFCDECREA